MRHFILVAFMLMLSTAIAEEKEVKGKVQEVFKSKEGVQLLHQTFSAACFNKTWHFIEKDKLSEEDIEDMLATSYASLWHWKQRSDCKKQNLSIAYWQLGRVNCLAGKTIEAKAFGEKCLKVSNDGNLDPFYIGYAYEVLLNTAILEKDFPAAKKYLGLARAELEKVKDKDNRKYLKTDLDKLASLIK